MVQLCRGEEAEVLEVEVEADAPPVYQRFRQEIEITLQGTQVRDHARMCIPDLNVLVDYPIDFRFPAFGWTR